MKPIALVSAFALAQGTLAAPIDVFASLRAASSIQLHGSDFTSIKDLPLAEQGAWNTQASPFGTDSIATPSELSFSSITSLGVRVRYDLSGIEATINPPSGTATTVTVTATVRVRYENLNRNANAVLDTFDLGVATATATVSGSDYFQTWGTSQTPLLASFGAFELRDASNALVGSVDELTLFLIPTPATCMPLAAMLIAGRRRRTGT